MIAGFADEADGPGFPPRATTYSSDAALGHAYPAPMLKFPDESVLSAGVSSALAADPLPVVPAAYSCTLAPISG
jgi:hypothetical protein